MWTTRPTTEPGSASTCRRGGRASGTAARRGPLPAILAVALALAPATTGAGVAGPQATGPLPRLVDVTGDAGIDFRHRHGGTGDRHLPETMGSGVAWLDFDVDGAWDLYFVQSGRLPVSDPSGGEATPSGVSGPGATAGSSDRAGTGRGRSGANVLYRGNGEGHFAAAPAGVEDAGYGMGVAVADYDLDGWPDLFVSNFGRNALYRNLGDGTFEDVTAAAGLEGTGWSASAAWADLDGDAFPELYVTGYLDYDLRNPLRCGRLEQGIVSYCHVELFSGVADRLYHNRGDGTFEDVAAAAGVADADQGKGLGVSMADLDGDGNLDIYVANDTTGNFLYRGRGDLTFEDVGLLSGTAFSADGRPQAGMGVATADLDGDGVPEIAVTNFAYEPMNLYQQVAAGAWIDDTFPMGVGEASLAPLGFGVVAVDLDGDGDTDLAVANGHILDNVERIRDGSSHAQSNQVLVNLLADRGRPGRSGEPLFIDASGAAGEAITRRRVSRGLAHGDADGDGWPDVAVTNSNGPAELLRNATAAEHRRLVVRLRGRSGNRDAIGARVRVTPAEGSTPGAWLQVGGGTSYCSQPATDLYFGLGASARARVDVQWPDGSRDVIEEVGGDRLVLVVQGRGVVASRSLRPHGTG